MLGWMFVVTLLLFTIAKGRWYYMGPAYPMLYAAGAVWGEGWLAPMPHGRAMTIRWAVWAALAFEIVFTTAFWLPLAPLNSRWWAITNEVQGDFREQIGWRELVQEVAKIRDSLSPEERAHLGIIGTNYGEAGAINLYGPEYGLPRAISGINSFWYRGYGDPPPQTVIVIGLSRKYLESTSDPAALPGTRGTSTTSRTRRPKTTRTSGSAALRKWAGLSSGRTFAITANCLSQTN